jgi:hypothetical protein
VVTWLLLAVLGIIWVALLFPSRSRSPRSSIEDFEQRMNLLAEANRAVPGRWVLMPRKGQRFTGPDQGRALVRRRRRQVFMVLLEATGLTLIMGIFPPFRIMLWFTAILVIVLLAYMAALVKLRGEEVERARLYRVAGRRDYKDAYGYTWPDRALSSYHPAAYGDGYGYVDAASNGYGNGRAARTVGGNRYQHVDRAAEWLESGLRLVDDDVHVVVYRSDEKIDTSSLTPAGS